MHNKKVDFLVIGAQKAGTSALRNTLSKHPELSISEREGHFFDRPDAFFLLPSPIREAIYRRRFPETESTSFVAKGEFTPSYLYWRKAARRIVRYNPHIRLIAILRNPIERAYSHYSMERSRGREPLGTFEEAINAELTLLDDDPRRQDRVRSYIQRGFYSEQISRYLQLIPRNQLLIMRHEDWFTNPRDVLVKVQLFLGVSVLNLPSKQVFVGNYDRMNTDTRKRLQAIFAVDIEATSTLTGLDLSNWVDTRIK